MQLLEVLMNERGTIAAHRRPAFRCCAPTIIQAACAAVLISGEVHSQARGSLSSASKNREKTVEAVDNEVARATALAELDTWLRRLTGRFRYDGVREELAGVWVERDSAAPFYRRETVKGLGDCRAVGTGPGVHCVLNVTWGPTSTLAPAMIQYGIDPDNLGVRYLQVNNRGIAEEALGFLRGNRATFKTECVNVPAIPKCRLLIHIDAAEGKPIQLRITPEFDYQLGGWTANGTVVVSLHRVTETQEDEALEAPVREDR